MFRRNVSASLFRIGEQAKEEANKKLATGRTNGVWKTRTWYSLKENSECQYQIVSTQSFSLCRLLLDSFLLVSTLKMEVIFLQNFHGLLRRYCPEYSNNLYNNYCENFTSKILRLQGHRIFQLTWSFQPHYGSGFDSASSSSLQNDSFILKTAAISSSETLVTI
jgi:hypothetical protein